MIKFKRLFLTVFAAVLALCMTACAFDEKDKNDKRFEVTAKYCNDFKMGEGIRHYIILDVKILSDADDNTFNYSDFKIAFFNREANPVGFAKYDKGENGGYVNITASSQSVTVIPGSDDDSFSVLFDDTSDSFGTKHLSKGDKLSVYYKNNFIAYNITVE